MAEGKVSPATRILLTPLAPNEFGEMAPKVNGEVIDLSGTVKSFTLSEEDDDKPAFPGLTFPLTVTKTFTLGPEAAEQVRKLMDKFDAQLIDQAINKAEGELFKAGARGIALTRAQQLTAALLEPLKAWRAAHMAGATSYRFPGSVMVDVAQAILAEDAPVPEVVAIEKIKAVFDDPGLLLVSRLDKIAEALDEIDG